MPTPKAKQIVDAIKTRLLAITEDGGSPVFFYRPDKVAVHPFTKECCDPSIATAYVIELDENEAGEDTTSSNLVRMRYSIIGLRKLKIAEHPYNVDPNQPDRATEQDRLEADVCNKLLGSADGITLGGLVENIAANPIQIHKGPNTFVDGWAVVFFRFTTQFTYVRGAA